MQQVIVGLSLPAEADILKDLAAEQAKILASRSRRSSVNTVTESEPLGEHVLRSVICTNLSRTAV